MKPEADGARPKPAVCRRLFADEDPADEGLRDNMFNQITEQINRNMDDACKKYNFDFRTEVPLEGDWTWERITVEGDQPGTEPLTAPLGGSEGPKGTPTQPPPTSDPQAPPAGPLQPPTVPQ